MLTHRREDLEKNTYQRKEETASVICFYDYPLPLNLTAFMAGLVNSLLLPQRHFLKKETQIG